LLICTPDSFVDVLGPVFVYWCLHLHSAGEAAELTSRVTHTTRITNVKIVAKRRPVSGLRSRRRGAGPAAVTADKRRRRNLICAHPAGTLPGKRRKGGPRTSWNGYITTRTGLKPEQLIRQVEERLQRRQTVHSAANPQTEDAKDKTVSYCTTVRFPLTLLYGL